ncbi:RPA-related protein RADX isoform X2 [Genypterus blacodes]|uniref:RPA-related protein RADX isoform X2 n=1 Tax=Genypterus blacodes TaxID=154954 RepID=UPI003F7770D6
MERPSSSSTVASASQPSFLQRTLERLFSTKSLKLTADEACPVAVVSLWRYLSEQSDSQLGSYSYDVTITDGTWRAKCFLDSALNHLVHTNHLRTGTGIRLTQCSFVYNERRLGHGFIQIEKLLLCGAQVSAVLLTRVKKENPSVLPLLVKHGMERSLVLQRDVPLQVTRKHYLPLWNNDDPEGDAWISGPPSSDQVLDVSKITLLCDLESAQRNTRNTLPLLVRIIHRSRLRYYGKFGLKIDFPYQAYFEVADQSGSMSLVLWNDLCPEFFQRLTVGTVLYLQNYTLKPSYSNRSRPQMDHHRMRNFTSVEICLNPRSPASVITVVSPKSVVSQWGLPDVAYQFTTRSELDNLTNNSACDVIGLVTFVGRVQRVKSKGNKGPEKFWTYRWIHAVDGTSERPFILELFSSSQPDVFNHICPMTYLVCTQMRVCQVEGSLPYLTSSCETEMFITGYHKGQPYVCHPRVKSFIQWTKTLKDSTVLQKTAVGGHYCYPHAPQTFTQSAADTSGQLPLVAAADLKSELETLQYREHKRLAIQGQIVAARYLKRPKSSEPQGTDTQQVPDVSTDAHQPADPDTHIALMAEERPDSLTTSGPSSPGEEVTVGKRKRSRKRGSQQSSHLTAQTKRRPGRGHAEEETQSDATSEAAHNEEEERQQPNLIQDPDRLCWESSSWLKQKEDVSTHLHHGGLYDDSVSQTFTLDERNVLLQWCNLHPSQWTPEQNTDTVRPAVCPGYYQITILGLNKQIAVEAAFLPVVHSGDPRAVGLPRNHHDNTMLSCLSSGFLGSLSDSVSQSEDALPEPEEVLVSAKELDEAHVVCVLDVCHLGADKVEVLINKVYRVTEFSQV